MWLGLGLLRKWDSGSGSECTGNGMCSEKGFEVLYMVTKMGQEVYQKWTVSEMERM